MMLSISATALVLMTMMIVVVLTDRALLDRVLSFEQFDLAAARSRSAGSAASFRMGATRQVEESPVEEPAREYAAPALVRRHEDGPRAASTPWEAQQAYLRCLTIWVSCVLALVILSERAYQSYFWTHNVLLASFLLPSTRKPAPR